MVVWFVVNITKISDGDITSNVDDNLSTIFTLKIKKLSR